MDGFGAHRPSLERQKGRPAKWKQRLAAEFARQRLDHAPAPTVERMLETVARLRARGKCAPGVAPGHPGENDCANVSEFIGALALLLEQSAARSQAGSADGGEHSLNLGP